MKTEVLVKEKDEGEGSHNERHSSFVLLGLLIITAIVFSGSLNLEWTNWDDDRLIYNNKLVQEGNLKDIITPPANPADNITYNPLVISSFALEWKLIKNNPFLYHLDNLILHLLCTALVWFFFRKIGLSVWWSAFAALLFGIHPMRVESVAWLTERKDLFYALFYLAALLAYIRYIASIRNRYLVLTFIFFTMSLYSKVQAVMLPFSLILLDGYFRRKIDAKAIVEKVVFFAGSLTIGVSVMVGVNYLTKRSEGITYGKILFFLKYVVLSGYAYVVYILKAVFPYATSVLYPVPASLQMEHWSGAVLAVVLFVFALFACRKHRFFTFGLLFFTINIILLPMASMTGDSTFLNDRYTYVAYIGLFFLIAMGMQQLLKKYPSYRLPIVGFAVVLLIALSVLTVRYIPVWKNSETLWADVIKKYPRQIPVAYINRSHYRYNNNQSDRAIEDLNTAIELNPEYSQAYLNRGFIYLKNNDFTKALQDYNRYLDLMSPCDTSGNILNLPVSNALGNRGLIYSKMGQYEKALMDFNLSIKLNPPNLNNYFNRASVYQKLGRLAEARQDVRIVEDMGALVDPSFRKLLRVK
jgi:protein O-mannosyl-transferase